MKISNRAEIMPSSPIRKLSGIAQKIEAEGIKVYHLNIGQPDLPTPQIGIDALKNVSRKVLEYTPSQGFLSLRKKLCDYYEQYQIKFEPDDIIVTSGGSEAVLFAFMTCLNPGDEIIVPEPAYANYMAFAVSAGAVIKPIVSTIEDGFALPPVEKFEELITERTKGGAKRGAQSRPREPREEPLRRHEEIFRPGSVRSALLYRRGTHRRGRPPLRL